MPTRVRRTVLIIIGIEVVIALAILFHFGENASNKGISLFKFTPLLGALVGSSLTLFSVFFSAYANNPSEPWLGKEQRSWILIGCGQFMWGFGESFWRYYTAIGQQPFPSWADAGYSCFPALCFLGLLLQPSSGGRLQRTLVALDSLVAMGALLAISWFLLLGAVAQTPQDSVLAKFLSLYYPTADVCLLSCVVFLLMRGQSGLYQATARKASLFAIGLGLCFFATSDFIFNLQQNAGTYVDGTMVDVGWPLGMLTIGLAAYLRSFLPHTTQDIMEERRENRIQYMGFRPIQLVPYVLIVALFAVLTFNVLSVDKAQMSIRMVLVLATIFVICLVLVRQILTIRENERLSRLQARALLQIEEQARHIEERNKELEEGISHLKAVQTSLANGNLRARASLRQGVLWSLASSVNLLAERLASLGESRRRLDILTKALIDLGGALERFRAGKGFTMPQTCVNVPEISPIIHGVGMQKVGVPQPPYPPRQESPWAVPHPPRQESPWSVPPQGDFPPLPKTPRPPYTPYQEHPWPTSPREDSPGRRPRNPVILDTYEPPTRP